MCRIYRIREVYPGQKVDLRHLDGVKQMLEDFSFKQGEKDSGLFYNEIFGYFKFLKYFPDEKILDLLYYHIEDKNSETTPITEIDFEGLERVLENEVYPFTKHQRIKLGLEEPSERYSDNLDGYYEDFDL